MNARRGATKRHEDTSALDRWQKDEIYRACHLVHGWTEEWVKYLDYISKIDISHEAPYRQRRRYESTVLVRRVDSNKQAGPLCQRPDYKSSANALVSLQGAQGKGVPQIPMHLRTRRNNTQGSRSSTTLEIVEFQLEDVFLVHLHPQHGKKAQRGGLLYLGTINGKNGTLKGGKTKNGEISNNVDNARVTHTLVQGEQGDVYGDVRARRSQLLSLSSSPETGIHVQSCALRRFFLSGSFASGQWQLPWTRRRCVQYNTSPYAHTRCARHMWLHVWLKGLTILCVSTKVISSSVMSLLNVPSTVSSCFLTVYYHTDATDWNQTKPVCDSALKWTVWPSGRSDSKHRLWAQVLHRGQ